MYKQEKVNNAIKKLLATIILKELDFSNQTIITITRVECSSNMFFAKVFVSVIPENERDDVINVLDNNVRKIQSILNKKLQIRPVPRIEFVKEKMTESAARIEKILGDIEKKEKGC